MTDTDQITARLENVRRSFAMAPARSTVTLHREDILDLLELALLLAAERNARG